MYDRLLRGDRPYWYIHQSANFTKARGTYLTQTPVTCEAGPGSPSGHVMANVILFVVICDVADTYFIKSRFIFAAWFYPFAGIIKRTINSPGQSREPSRP